MTTVLPFAVTVAALLTAAYFLITMWGHRSRPAARPLFWLSALILGYLLVHLALFVPGPLRDGVVSVTGVAYEFGAPFRPESILIGIGGALWFLFALQYTGRGERLTKPLVAVFGLFWSAILGLATVGWLLGIELAGEPLVDQLLSLGLFTMVALLILGLFLIAEVAGKRNAIGNRESGLLFSAAFVFSITSLVSTLVTEPVVPALALFLVVLQFVVAVRLYPIFEVLPVARVRGRDLLIREIDDGVLVIDRTRRVRDLNTAAQTMLGVDRDAVLGRPLGDLLPESLDVEALMERQDQLQTADGRALAVTVDQVTDSRGRQFGYVLRLADVTDRRRREHRLGVLSQLLTGAIEQQLATVATEAATSARNIESGTADTPVSAVGREIQATVKPLKRLVGRTREIERGLEAPAFESVSVRSLVSRVTPSDGDGSSVDGELTARTDPDVVTAVLELLLAGTGEARQVVDLSVPEPSNGPEIHVTERLPTELSADRRRRREVTIEIARLAIESVDGTLSVTESAPERQTLVIQLPRDEGDGVSEPQSETTRGRQR